MSRSIRVYYQGVHGRQRTNFNWPPIGLDSAVIITAAEFRPDFGERFPGPIKTPGRPWLGEGNVYVTNIGPHGPEPEVGGVEFYLHADTDSPINVTVTITVLDDIETFSQA